MTTPGDTVNEVVRTIAPVSVAHAEAARSHITASLRHADGLTDLDRDGSSGPTPPRARPGDTGLQPTNAQPPQPGGGQTEPPGATPKVDPGGLTRLAACLGGAQHADRPTAKQRFLIVVAGDHGRTLPTDAGKRHPTVMAARAIADGTGALAQVARMSATPIILVNAGAAESEHFPHTAIALAAAPTSGTGAGPAMSLEAALRSLEAGIALAVSLSEQTMDLPLHSRGGSAKQAGVAGVPDRRSPASSVALLAVGAIGIGSEVAAAALLRQATSPTPTTATAITGTATLAACGTPQIGVLAGVMLGAASLRIPVILDSYTTGAAALVAAAIAPTITGYLIASHRGSHPMLPILARLGLAPVFDVGLGGGDGTGAAMVLPFADHIAALARDSKLP